MSNYFVTAIDTDSGKTLVSAILCETLQADYWKPVQAGVPRDTDVVKSLVSSRINFHPETYLLKTPASPHASAKIDGVEIELNQFRLPSTNQLVIEGAGGCLVPLNDTHFVIDLAAKFNCEVVLVSDFYLGSINHTLLTAACLKQRNCIVKGIIFNGLRNPDSENIILKHTGYKKLLHIDKEVTVNNDTVTKYAAELKRIWND